MTPHELRASLKRLLPGLSWTVHRQFSPQSPLVATGTKSAGSNRVATVQVTLRDGSYYVRSAGFGHRAERLLAQVVEAVTTGKTRHRYAGDCPDEANGWAGLDPECPACQVLAAMREVR